MTALNTIFTTAQQDGINALRLDLTRRVRRSVTAEYGSTDCGQQWAALVVIDLPTKSFGRPGPLVSLLTGTGIGGEAAVMGADGGTVLSGVSFPEALQAARDSALGTWAAITH